MNPFYNLRQQRQIGGPGWSLRLSTGPASEPVTVAQLKAQERIDGSDEDTYLGDLISVAREHLEDICGRACITQAWKQYFDRFPCSSNDFLELRRGPLISVASVKYTDSTGAQTTMVEGTDYLVNSSRDPGRIVLPYGGIWPAAVLSPASPVEVTFSVGHDVSPSTVPARMKQAILLLAAHLFQNREPVLSGSGVAAIEIPMSVEALIEPLRYSYFGD